MLQVQHVFSTPSGRKATADKAKLKFTCTEGDHLTLLNVYKAFVSRYNKRQRNLSQWCGNNYLNYKSLVRAIQIRSQLKNLLKKFKVDCELTCQDRTEPVLKCLTVAFFMNAATAHYSGDYQHLKSGDLNIVIRVKLAKNLICLLKFLKDLSLKIHPSSVVNLMLANLDDPAPKYIIYNDIVQSKTCYLMRDISVIDCKWLNELVPEYYEFGTEREIFEGNEKRQRVA